jgi:hypothetical protein
MSSLSVLAVVVALAQAAPPPTPVAIKVIEASFVQQDLGGGTYRVFPTTRIKYDPGKSCYSWLLRVEPQNAEVAITERFTLPAPATHWGNPDSNVSVDRSEASTELNESLDDGVLTNGWCVVEGDPIGKYVIDVFHGGRRLHRFTFEVTEQTY